MYLAFMKTYKRVLENAIVLFLVINKRMTLHNSQ